MSPRRRDTAWVALAMLLSCACQRSAGSPAAVTRTGLPAPAPGEGCRTLSVSGSCAFQSLVRQAPQGDGRVLFEVLFRDREGNGVRAFRVAAAATEEPALQSFYASHSPAPCAGTIQTAPCPPVENVRVEVPAPPVGELQRAPF